MLALVVLSASTFSFGQGSSTASPLVIKLKAPTSATPPATTPPSQPSTTPPMTSDPQTSNPPPPPAVTPLACSVMGLGTGASLNGFLPFQTTSAWTQNIANAPVDGNSGNLVGFIGNAHLHPDFASGTDNGTIVGIPFTVVSGASPTTVNYTDYGDQSDPGPMPIPTSVEVEGYPNPGDGDRHALVLDRDNCWLYELYGATPQGDGTWQASSGAVWDLLNVNSRPLEWTSSDAAGLPVFPGLVRYDEVAAGHIDHALRFTLQHSRQAFVAPATHWAPNSSDPNAAPMGMRMRLKTNYDISSFPPQAQIILTALKNYGMIMADNGSSLFLSGAPDDRWNNDDLHTLGQVPASAFEVVQMPAVTTQANLATGNVPNITSFIADHLTVSAGTAVNLSWAADNAGYSIVSPEVGAIRGNTAVVHPTQTTTYTLYSTNKFGRATQTVTVTVQ